MNHNIDKEYQNIFQEIKEEKMNWDFEDFLKKTEEESSETKIIPIRKKSSGNQKWYWLAASFTLLLGFGFYLKNYVGSIQNTSPIIVKHTNTSSNNEPKITQTTVKNNEDLPLTKKIDSDISPKKKKSKYKKQIQYLAKINKKTTPIPLESAPIEEKVEYDPNFVIINGKPVATEEEAILFTKNAIELLGGNINSALENAQPVKLLTVNF